MSVTDFFSISLAGAFLAGIVTLLSPCSALLLPAFFATASNGKRIFFRSGIFIIGLLTTLLPLGLFAGSLGSFFLNNRELLINSASIVLILLGLWQILALPLPSFAGKHSSIKDTSSASIFFFGAVYAVAGVCSGPALGTVLTLAASGNSIVYGGILLIVYGLGMGLPLLILALLWKPFGAKLRSLFKPRELRIKKYRNSYTAIISGLVSLIFGILLLSTHGTADLFSVVTTEQQNAVERGAQAFGAGVPDFLFIILIAGIAIVAILLAAKKSNKNAKTSEENL